MTLKPPTGTNDPLDDAQGFLDVVEDFGATGNGTTDDTAAIIAADTAARTAGSGVFFRAGTYLVSEVTYSTGSHWVGVGKRASVLKMKDNTANTGVLRAIARLTGTSATDFSFKSLGFYGNRANGNHSTEAIFGIHTQDASRFHIEDCEFRNFRGEGIYIGYSASACQQWSVRNCDFSDCGVKESGDSGNLRMGIAVIAGSDFEINGCYFDSIGAVAIDLEANLDTHQFKNGMIRGNRFGLSIPSFFINVAPGGTIGGAGGSATATSAAANATGLQIIGNVGRGTPNRGLFIRAQGFTVAGNTWLSVANVGILAGIGSAYGAITANTVKATTNAGTSAGIYLDGDGSAGVTFTTVSGNSVPGTAPNTGVEERPGSNDNTLGPNAIEKTTQYVVSGSRTKVHDYYSTQTTVGAAGGASALPATPLGYFKQKLANGTTVAVPYYTA